MARYIDADKIRDRIQQLRDDVADCEGEYRAYNVCLREVEKATLAADVEEVKHGEWIRHEPNSEQMKEFHDMGIGKAMALNSIYWTCSCCDTWGTPRYNYCPYCSAKMDGGNVE